MTISFGKRLILSLLLLFYDLGLNPSNMRQRRSSQGENLVEIALSFLFRHYYYTSTTLFRPYLSTGYYPKVWLPTCDGEDGGGVAQRDELVFATAVVDDQLHVVGAQSHVIRRNGEGGGRTACHLPEATFHKHKCTNTSEGKQSNSNLTDFLETMTGWRFFRIVTPTDRSRRKKARKKKRKKIQL